MKYVCLTFDIEKFDLPLQYQRDVDPEKMFDISYEGTLKVIDPTL